MSASVIIVLILAILIYINIQKILEIIGRLLLFGIVVMFCIFAYAIFDGAKDISKNKTEVNKDIKSGIIKDYRYDE